MPCPASARTARGPGLTARAEHPARTFRSRAVRSRYPDLLAAFRRAYPDKARTVSSGGADGAPAHDGHSHGTNGHSARPTSDGTLASAEAALKHSAHALEHARQHVKQLETALERARAEVRRAEGRVTADQTYLEALRRAEQGGGASQAGAASPKA